MSDKKLPLHSKPGEPVFWISGDCPLHAPSPPAALEEKP